MKFEYDICIIGGLGHVGLPLGIVFSDSGLNVCLFDINETAAQIVLDGNLPFYEKNAQKILKNVLLKGKLHISLNPNSISKSKFLIIVIGTPVDEHLNPEIDLFKNFFDSNIQYLLNNQIIILRSTVYPGTTEWLFNYLKSKNLKIGVSCCPERISEGMAIDELKSLPQITSACDLKTLNAVNKLFKNIVSETITVTPKQAELTKLYTNSWRYIQFAVANQFYMLANEFNEDFYSIFDAMTYNYPRTKGFPKAGFTAGPCLLKDTMQLSAFSNNRFFLGHSAMLINEGMPNFIVKNLIDKYDLKNLIVGILGMAFKAESDDKRDSLSYKLLKILRIESKKVLYSDEYIDGDGFVSSKYLIKSSDIIIIGVPHRKYQKLNYLDKIVIDIWDSVSYKK